MKYLKSYNESAKPTNEDFQIIADTLQSDIFHEYNIPQMQFLTSRDNVSDEDRWSKHWDFSSSDPYDSKIKEVSQINIRNLNPKESKGIMEKIIELIPTIKGRTGLDIDIDEYVNDGIDFVSYDITIKVKENKHINEFFNFFKRGKNMTYEEVESKTEELAYILYDIFDEYDIADANDQSEPDYSFWSYGRYAFTEKNPKDRIIIGFPKETDPIDGLDPDYELVARGNKSYIPNIVFHKIEEMKKSIEDQIGCEIRIHYNLKRKGLLPEYTPGRIVISLAHTFRLTKPGHGDLGPG